MTEAALYNQSSLSRQMALVRDTCRALSQHHGFEREYEAALAAAAHDEKAYADAFLANSAANLQTVAAPLQDREKRLENAARPAKLPPHPAVAAFNALAAERGLETRVYDSGPKDYCTAKIKAQRTDADVLRLPDVTRIMVTTNDPETHADICRRVAAASGSLVSRQENTPLPGFVSDLYTVAAPGGGASELSFVPAGILASSDLTHNILRYLRASSHMEDDAAAQDLFDATCDNIRADFNKVAAEVPLDAGRIASLGREPFNRATAAKTLNALREDCLQEAVNRPQNRNWAAYLSRQRSP